MKIVQKKVNRVNSVKDNSNKICKIVIRDGKMVSHTVRERRLLEVKLLAKK